MPLITVGRWMSDAEFQQMITTGRVVESALNGLTNVIFPASKAGYAAAAAGDYYVEFEVDDSRVLRVAPPPPWGKIFGPSHLFAPVYGITDMPRVFRPRRVL